jgi:hypothetical protein
MAYFDYTFKEKTVRRHNVGFIHKQVRAVLDLKNIKGMCMNKMPADHGQLYTTEQASRIINDVVQDSIYYR